MATLEKNRVTELRGQAHELKTEAKAILDAAEEEKRDLTAEEEQEFDRIIGDADKLDARAARFEKATPDGVIIRQIKPDADDEGWQEMTPEERAAEKRLARVVNLAELRDRIFAGEAKAPESFKEYNELRAASKPQDQAEYRWAFWRMMTEKDLRSLDGRELRALSKASAGAGANLVPTSFRNVLVDALREYGIMRQQATVLTTTSGETIQVPTVSAHGTAAWIAENGAFTPSDETFGQSSLSSFKAATIMLVSEELLTDSAFDLEAFIRVQFGIRIGILENTAYLVGDGSGKPTGVATQASAGVTSATATTITADNLVDLYHSLLSPYRQRASWIFKDSTIALLRKVKTGISGDTTYIWQPGLQAGAPDTLLGRPVYVDPDMAAATTGLISGLFGDFSWYWVRDVDGIAFQRLDELYAANGQVGFRAYHRTDGKLMNTAAVKKLTQA